MTEFNTSVEELEEVAKANLIGETYSFGKRDITIQDLSLRKDGNKIAVDLTVSGDHEGVLELKGVPSFDAANKQIDIKKVEFKLATKKLLVENRQMVIHRFNYQ